MEYPDVVEGDGSRELTFCDGCDAEPVIMIGSETNNVDVVYGGTHAIRATH